jgi:hypothetical protein
MTDKYRSLTDTMVAARGLAVRVTDCATLNGSVGIGVGHGDVGGPLGATIHWWAPISARNLRAEGVRGCRSDSPNVAADSCDRRSKAALLLRLSLSLRPEW